MTINDFDLCDELNAKEQKILEDISKHPYKTEYIRRCMQAYFECRHAIEELTTKIEADYGK